MAPHHVDWKRGVMTVESPKTERHQGHDKRDVPVTPKLMELLKARLAEMGDQQYLVRRRGGQIYRVVNQAVESARVEVWDQLFQTLRRSCEKEWAMTQPQYAVSKWIGHDIGVSGRHYVNSVPAELFDRMRGTSRRSTSAHRPR
jgi:integrase